MSKNKHNQIVGSSIERSNERIDETGEVFTPMDLCREMIDDISEEDLKNPESKFLDNCAGNGNFIIALRDKLVNYHTEEYVLNNMLYAVELMEDNHKELCERVGVPVNHPHYVCHDALTYDYSFGKPVGVERFF